MLAKYHIRGCTVQLNRLSDCDILKASREEKLLLIRKEGILHTNVSWLPNLPQTQKTSEALTALSAYHDQNNIVPLPSARKNVRRQRAKSMLAERSNDPSNSASGKFFTMEDMHSEYTAKYASPNRGLKSIHVRLLPEPKSDQPPTEWEKLRDEFKKKIEAKMAEKAKKLTSE